MRVSFSFILIALLVAGVDSKAAARDYSQDFAWVRGIVYDAGTQEPLPGADVLYGKGRGTVTDGDGEYRFRVEAGAVNITFHYLGYKTESRHLQILPGDTVFLNMAMHVQATEMNRVVVSAGRTEQRLSDLTVSVSLIKPEAITAAHITDAQELINRTSGVEVLDGQASIRGGSGYSYGAGSRVMVLIDGLPMLSADAGHVRWQSLPFENLEQVEIIKGASSVLYGSSAMNGIINFRTADALSKDGVTKVFTETGVFDKPRRQEWVWWDSPRLSSSTSVSHLRKQGNTDIGAGAFFTIDNGYRLLNENKLGRVNLMLKHRDAKIQGLRYGVSFNGMYNRKQDFVLWEDARTGALKQDESTAQRLFGTSITVDPFIGYKPGARFSHELKSRFQYTQNYYPDGGRNNSDGTSLYSEYQMRYTANGVLSLNSGLMQYSSKIVSPFYGDHNAFNAAFYTQADIIPANRVKLVAGVRMEHNALDGLRDKLVPLFRAGINYRVFNITFLRASFGQGYRYPSIAEKHASTTLGAVRIFPSPLIRAESGWNSELAVKQGVKTRYFEGLVDFALFYSQNNDLIEYVFGIYPDPLTQSYGLGFRATNIEHSRVYGSEIEILLNTSVRQVKFTLTGGYVFMYPVEFNPVTLRNTDTYLKFRRKHALNLNLTSSYRKFDFSLHSSARSRILNIDDVFLNPMTREDILPGFYDYWTEYNNSYFLMDAGIGYSLNSRYKLSLALKNITNSEYMGRPGDIRPHRFVSLRVAGKF